MLTYGVNSLLCHVTVFKKKYIYIVKQPFFFLLLINNVRIEKKWKKNNKFIKNMFKFAFIYFDIFDIKLTLTILNIGHMV